MVSSLGRSDPFADGAQTIVAQPWIMGLDQGFAKSGSAAQLKVLHVAETIKGGVGTYLAELVNTQLGHMGPSRIRVLVPEEHRLQVEALPDGIIGTFRRKSRSPSSLWALARHTLEEVRAFKPDIIHAHSTFAGVVVRLLFGWKSERPRIVYCPHGWSFDRTGAPANPFYRLCERLLAPLSDRIVAVSAYEAALGAKLGIGSAGCRVVMSGIAEQPPPAQATLWTDKRLKILFVGRPDPAKGLDVLLTAIDGMEDKMVLRVAGAQGADVGRPNSGNGVTFLGWLSASEIEGALAVADVVAIPSRNEAFGLIALEAMRAGKMVVASAVGGLPEIVTDGVTGRLVPPRDPKALRAALLMDGAEARALMGARGRERFVNEFTSAKMQAAIFALYADLMAERAASNPGTVPSAAIPR